MRFFAHLVLLSLAVMMFMSSSALAQEPIQEYLDPQNAARSEVRVGALRWDETLAAFARKYASQRTGDCNLVHSGGPYGENLSMSTGDMSIADAVKLWIDEKANYDYNSNTCDAGKQCGHYTQVVWRDSVQVGCAKVKCNNGGTFVGCNYNPPGNFIGQKPY